MVDLFDKYVSDAHGESLPTPSSPTPAVVDNRTANPNLATLPDDDGHPLPATPAFSQTVADDDASDTRTAESNHATLSDDDTLPLPATSALTQTVADDGTPAPHATKLNNATLPGDGGGPLPATPAITKTVADDDAPVPHAATPNNATLPDDGDAVPGAAPRTLMDWLSDDGEDSARKTDVAEMSIVSTLVAGGEAPRVAAGAKETVVTVDDIRRDWDGAAPGRSVSSSASVQVADPRTGRTVGVDIALRPTQLAYDDQPGATGDFAVGKRLGKGGMGAVFRARQLSLGREVALKVILPDQSESPRSRMKFIAEAVITGALDHPNIIPLHELGVTAEGLPFYAMKEVRGTPWSKAIGEKSEAENVAILLAVADAVAFAHDRGIIHRDLKPENVMLGDYGEVLLMDWGLAVSHFPDAAGQRVPKGRAGTPAYLAPEMARADEAAIGPASDLYLLGAILYEIAVGHPPHTGQNIFACIAAAANNVILPADRDDELIAIARRAMATRPEDRYATVKDFQAALTDHRRHEESLKVADHARAQLARARAHGGYEDFNRALFGFDEALALWGGNVGARAGQRETRLALAHEALRHGDSDLALATAADLGGDDFDRVRQQATTQKLEHEARQARVKRWRRMAVASVAAVLLVLAVSSFLIDNERRDAVKARDEAQRQTVIAKDALQATEEALEKVTAAQKARDAAEAREAAEREAKEKAKDAELAALRAQETERALRQDAQSAAQRSQALLTQAGYLENSERWAFDADTARERQQAAAAAAGRPLELAVTLPDGNALPFRIVPPGEFVMGSSTREAGRSADEYLHPVTLTRPFWLGTTELTRGQWRALIPEESTEELAAGKLLELLTGEDESIAWRWRTRPLAPGEAELPAVGISVRDARELLLPRLAALAPAGLAFRLPTEAEWEWSCRAGTATPYHTGSTTADALRAGWLDRSADGLPQPVGRREANAWGFFDMHGNVYEMVADYYGFVFALTDTATRENPRNDTPPDNRPLYVIRGGSHVSLPSESRSANRETVHDVNRHDDIGLRLVLADAPPPPADGTP